MGEWRKANYRVFYLANTTMRLIHETRDCEE